MHIDTGDSSADTAEEKPKEDDFFSTHEQSAALSAVQDDVIPTAAVAVKPAQNGNKVGCESLFYPSKLKVTVYRCCSKGADYGAFNIGIFSVHMPFFPSIIKGNENKFFTS